MQFCIDLGLVIILTLVSGVFVASEFALINLRESQIDLIEQKSKRGRIVAKIAASPDVFLSATQIGVTFVGFLSASFGAERLRPYIVPFFISFRLNEELADAISLVIMIILISYLSLVLGEFLPKKIAIQYSEQVSLITSPPLQKFTIIMKPLIWLISTTANGIYRIFGGNPKKKGDEISEDEIANIVEQNQSMEHSQRQILSDVLEASERSIVEVMKPRADVEFLNADMTLADAAVHVRDLPYSRFPVIGEDFDDVVGFVHVRDILDTEYDKNKRSDSTLRDVCRNVIKFPGTNRLFVSLREMRQKGIHLAIVQDEYGGTDGICTLEDIIEEMIGDIHDEYDVQENPEVRSFKDGTFSVDGNITLSDFEDETGIELEDGPYETVAGYILAKLGRVASVGDTVEISDNLDDSTDFDEEKLQSDSEHQKWLLAVSKIDGMRILRVKVKEQTNA